MMTDSQSNDKLLESNKFSCVKCSGFLWPPIMIGTEGNVCGNCWSDSMTSYIRNTLLEKIFEDFLIPCTFYENGCKEQDYYNNMHTHVKQCVYRNLHCPINEIVPECLWKGNSCTIVDHFVENHSSFIIRSETDSLSFPVYLNKIKDVKLIFIPSGIFLLLLSFEQDRSKVFCNLYNIVNYESKSFGFCIEQNIKDNSLIIYRTTKSNVPNICSLEDKNSHSNDIEIDLKIFNDNFMKDTCEYTLRVESKVFKENSSIKAMLKSIECPVCFNYMKSPIYQCNYGHSMCDTCTEESKFCPSCKSVFHDTRNYALEELINYLEFPCIHRNEGCTKLFTNEEKALHEENCYFKIYACPFKLQSCDWSGKYDQLIPHLKSAHEQQTYETSYYKCDKNISAPITSKYDRFFCLIAYQKVFLVYSKSLEADENDSWRFKFFGPRHEHEDYIPEVCLTPKNNVHSLKIKIFFTRDFSKQRYLIILIPRQIPWLGKEINYFIKILRKKTYKQNSVT